MEYKTKISDYDPEEHQERAEIISRLWLVYGRELSDGVIEDICEVVVLIPTKDLKRFALRWKSEETFPPTPKHILDMAESEGMPTRPVEVKKPYSGPPRLTKSEKDFMNAIEHDIWQRQFDDDDTVGYARHVLHLKNSGEDYLPKGISFWRIFGDDHPNVKAFVKFFDKWIANETADIQGG